MSCVGYPVAWGLLATFAIYTGYKSVLVVLASSLDGLAEANKQFNKLLVNITCLV